MLLRKPRTYMVEDPEQEKRRALLLRPQRLLDWEENADGKVVVLKPKFQNPVLQRYVLPRLRNPTYRIHLDEIGSFVWKRCDGGHTVGQILDEMRKEFGEQVEPALERLSLFLSQLFRGKFIRYV